MRPAEMTKLRGGLQIPVAVLNWALDQEAEGVSFAATPDGALTVSGGNLSDADRRLIGEWRLHLVALARYCERDHVRPADTVHKCSGEGR